MKRLWKRILAVMLVAALCLAPAAQALTTDQLKDLLLFYSAREKKMVTLAEYVEKMAEDQKFIYYALGENVRKILRLP